MPVINFEVIARKDRAQDLVPTIREASKEFRRHEKQGDLEKMRAVSEGAWRALSQLFDVLRNEQDQGRLDRSFMRATTGLIAGRLNADEQARFIAAKRVPASYPGVTTLNLRDVLNKTAHFDTVTATYRVDGRGAHYMVLGGPEQDRRYGYWVADILVSKLCNHAEAAVRALA